MSDSLKVIFANVNGDITAIKNITSSQLTTHASNITISDYVFGRYEYTPSNTSNGDTNTSNTGGFMLDTANNTLSVYTDTRELNIRKFFSAIETVLPQVTITAPTYDADVIYGLYELFGVENTLQFRPSQRGFADELQGTDPDNVLEEHALNDNAETVTKGDDVIREYRERSAYIESMTLQIPELTGNVDFTAPSIFDITPQSLDYETRIALHDRFSDIHESPGDGSLHPSEQWSEDIYTELTSVDGVPDRGVGIIGNGYDDTVIVAVNPSCQIQVRLTLQDMGFTPEMTDSYTGFEITPEVETSEETSETTASNSTTEANK